MTRTEVAKAALNEFPGCRKIAVENFLWSLMGTDRSSEQGNLLLDANLYRWDPQTIGAIAYGIDLFYNSLN